MLVDAALTTTDLQDLSHAARGIEAAGYDRMCSFEGAHDGFFPLLLAAEHTERVQLTTAVVIAFARNPMTLAQSAYDLQLASRGRFNLGLGTQIRPHIEKRFSMEWSKPVERMREMVLAVRGTWRRCHPACRFLGLGPGVRGGVDRGGGGGETVGDDPPLEDRRWGDHGIDDHGGDGRHVRGPRAARGNRAPPARPLRRHRATRLVRH